MQRSVKACNTIAMSKNVNVTVQNPSVRLLNALGFTEKDLSYQQTCHNRTCGCMSHDSGYYYVMATIPEGLAIHHYPGSAHCHGHDVLHEEYIEDKTAKGLPANSPKWAYTLDTRKVSSGVIYTGKGVDVSTDGNFTVVRLMDSSKYGWREANVFATRDGVHDHTKEFRRMRFTRLRTERLEDFRLGGLTDEESERLFQIGKEQWTREQEGLLIVNAPALRQVSGYHLKKMATRHSRSALNAVAQQAGVLELLEGLSHPRATAFAMKALWVFHGKKINEEVKEVSSLQDRPGLVNLEALFAGLK